MTHMDVAPGPDIVSRDTDRVDTYPAYYFLALIVLAAAWFLTGLVFYGIPVGYGSLTIYMSTVIWALGAAHFATSFRIVEPDYFAGVLVFGTPTVVVTGKPLLVPMGIFKVIEISRGIIQMELPNEPNLIFRKEDVEIVPPGMSPPIRVTFKKGVAGDDGFDPNDPFDDRSTQEVTPIIRFRIQDEEGFWTFFVRLGGFDEARKQAEDMSIAVLQQWLTALTLRQAFAGIGTINRHYDDYIRAQTKGWGIEIDSAHIKLIGLSHSFNTAIQDIPRAKAEKLARTSRAEAKQIELTREGLGEANARKALLFAEASGLEEKAKSLGVTGHDMLGADTARAIGESGNMIIVGAQGLTEAVTAAFAAGKGMQGKPKPTPPATEPGTPPTGA
ncbi:MAG: hypothetical protein JWL87_18 [Candidatus Adlerbacteria bacterium]|nr:hypothetical protein [Candidatus Adlerbacteria bacterium]